MNIRSIHSHLGGHEWIHMRRRQLWGSIIRSIEDTRPYRPCDGYEDAAAVLARSLRRVASRFKRTQAERSFEVRRGIESVIVQRVCLGIGLIHDERPTIDLAAHYLSLYVGDVIDVGVEVLPMKEMQENMSSGPGYYEGALYDLARQGRGVPAVPLVLIGVRP